MEFHRGRLIDHIHLRVADLDKSKKFYRAILAELGLSFVSEDDRHFSVDELYVSPVEDPLIDTRYTSRVHLAFQADTADAIARFHKAGLEAGGTDNGQPGERPYHPGYYGAFLLDPDGNNIEAVSHGPQIKSADSVRVKPAPDHPMNS